MAKLFKIRCSAIGKIMSGTIGLTEAQEKTLSEYSTRKEENAKGNKDFKPLTKNMEEELTRLIFKRDHPELPEGAKTYCEEWVKSNNWKKRKKDFKAIVIEKGLKCELDGITFIRETFGYEDCEKNDEFFENEYIEGSPDVLQWKIGKVRDTKLSWDVYTFPMFETVIPNSDYEWQLQGYMILTKYTEASLDYVLIDTPQALVDQDLKKLYFQSGGLAEQWTPENYKHLYENYKFSDIPAEKRIKSFEVKFDPTLEAKIVERVIMCRAYIETIWDKGQAA